MEHPFSPELMLRIRSYLLGKWQGPEYADRIGAPKSLRELLDMVARKFPADSHAVTQILVRAVTAQDDRGNFERRQRIAESARRDGWGYGWDLPDGVPAGPSLEAFSTRDNQSVAKAKAATLDWLAKVGPPILVLVGGTGTGKTHLAVAAGQSLVGAGPPVLYRTEPELMGELRGCIKDSTLEDRFAAFSVVPWLIIDDFGVEAVTDWSRSLQDRLVNARWMAGDLRTLVTTNLKSSQMPARVASRLGDTHLSRLVQIAAPDFRTQGA